MTTSLTYRSYAKINLYLDVLPPRPDGFHDIETLFHTVDLHDTLVYQETPSGITLSCSESKLDSGNSNMVHQAAELVQQYARCTRGVHVRLDKRIPIAAGLAGGSGDAAATLAALNLLWDINMYPEELERLALHLGSDVPYCLNGGPMAALGRGEVMTPVRKLPRLWFVLVHPPLEVSAARVYNSELLEKNAEERIDGMTPSFRKALEAYERREFHDVVFNRMESAVFSDYPHLAEIKQDLLDAECIAAAMSGSGPTVFGITRTKREATQAAARFKTFETSVVRPAPTGIDRVE